VALAAVRRVAEELGVRSVRLTEIGVYAYRAEDRATGRVEHEYDHVLFGRVPATVPVRPDPAEVAALRWLTAAELAAQLDREPESYAPWVAGVARRLTPEILWTSSG
jgi:isopentenyl-diphosphate delta-isomerase